MTWTMHHGDCLDILPDRPRRTCCDGPAVPALVSTRRLEQEPHGGWQDPHERCVLVRRIVKNPADHREGSRTLYGCSTRGARFRFLRAAMVGWPITSLAVWDRMLDRNRAPSRVAVQRYEQIALFAHDGSPSKTERV